TISEQTIFLEADTCQAVLRECDCERMALVCGFGIVGSGHRLRGRGGRNTRPRSIHRYLLVLLCFLYSQIGPVPQSLTQSPRRCYFPRITCLYKQRARPLIDLASDEQLLIELPNYGRKIVPRMSLARLPRPYLAFRR